MANEVDPKMSGRIEPGVLIIVATGATHRKEVLQASQMWTGPYHTACLRYAEYLAGGDSSSIRILSPIHGLLKLDDMVDPKTLDNKGKTGKSLRRLLSEVTETGSFAGKIREQALVDGLLMNPDRGRKVIVLAAESWVGVCSQVWKEAELPFKTLGMGEQISRMNEVLGGGLKPVIQRPLSPKAHGLSLGDRL